MLGVSLVVHEPRAAPAARSASPSALAYTVARRSRSSSGSCCREPLESVFGDAEDELLDVDRRRPDDRGRRDLGDRLQRRPAARRGHGASFGRIRALAPVLRMSIAYPLRSRFRTGATLAMFTLVVFTLVDGRRRPGSFVNAFDDVDDLRRRLRRPRQATVGGGADRRTWRRRCSARRASTRRTSRSSASQSVLAGQGAQLGTGRRLRDLPRRAASTPRSSTHTTYGLGARSRAATARRRRSGTRSATQPGLAVVDSFVVPRRDNWNFGVAARLPAQRLLPRGRDVRPGPDRASATSRPAGRRS